MAEEVQFDTVDALAVGALGSPGNRAFYIQARDAFRTLTMLVEKVQVQAIAERAIELLRDRDTGPSEEPAELIVPADPDWRAGELGIGFEPDEGRVVLVARQAPEEEDTPEDSLASVRAWLRPAQVLAFAAKGLELVRAGRPLCPVCGMPMDPGGHACPRRNGKSPIFN